MAERGTSLSLAKALGAGSPVLAHDNRFNRWVAGEGATYLMGQYETLLARSLA